MKAGSMDAVELDDKTPKDVIYNTYVIKRLLVFVC